jgi:hypothetical protein
MAAVPLITAKGELWHNKSQLEDREQVSASAFVLDPPGASSHEVVRTQSPHQVM